MFFDRCSQRVLSMLLLVPLVGSMTCCTSLKKYHPYPAQYAWAEMRQDRDDATALSPVLAKTTGMNVDLAKALRDAEQEASKQARNENLPSTMFDEMVADVSTDLLQALDAEASESPYLLYLGLGKIRTQGTGSYTQEQLDAITSRIADRLLQNQSFRSNFAVQQTRSGDVRSVVNEVGQNPNWSVDPQTGVGSDKVPLQDLYVLTGTFDAYSEREGQKVSSKFNVMVQRASTNELVYSKELSRQYYFHPSLRRYVAKPENLAKLNALDERHRAEAMQVMAPDERSED